MKQSSWACTIFIQLSLCLVIYVSLHLGHSFLVSDRDLNNANGRHLDLYFITVSGGFRSLHRQTHLLKLMGRVVKSYNARFVVSISEFGDKDPLFRNATRVSSSLKLPWFTTGASRESESGNFMKRIKLPLGGTLDIVFIGNGSSRMGLVNEVSRVSGINRLNELRRTLEAADADWRIVVGSDPLIIYEQHKEAKQVDETLHRILINNGVNVYLSDKGCINEANHNEIACIAVPTPTDSAREMEDGFLLHRVSFSDLVTYFFNSSGQVIDTRFIKQKGNEAM